MADSLATAISVLALAISATTAWLTLFRRGTVKMSQPTVIFFGPDASKSPSHVPPPKIYLRTLLFSTSKRGRVIESMHASLHRNETKQNFSVWVHGEDKLSRGSGLFVGETGVAANHHFLAPRDGSAFRFLPGGYQLKVYARIIGDKSPKLLFSQTLELSLESSNALQERGNGVYFDWGPDSAKYLQHVDRLPQFSESEAFIEAMALNELFETRLKPKEDVK